MISKPRLYLSLAYSSTSASLHSPLTTSTLIGLHLNLKCVKSILFSCPNKQSDSDAILTWLLKECAAFLIPTITNTSQSIT